MLLKITRTKLQFCFVLFSFLITFTAIAQQRRVTGRVLGADRKPVAGASVTINGTTTGTQTDAAGNFSVSVPGGKNALTISSVGFESQNVTIPASNNISTTLRTATSNLNEIVVTGYSTQRKKDLTGSVAVVDVANMKKVPAGTGEEALQGQASGVTIVTSGQPGAGSDLRIRGFSSLGANDPLVIVDGVPGDLHNINVNDIESLQVLKDASASIYGIRGSNGVVIITTKKGRPGKAKVTYDAYYGVTEKGKGFDLATPQQTADAIWLQMLNSGLKPSDSTWGTKQYGKGVTPVLPDYLIPTGAKVGDPNTDPSTYDQDKNQITLANKAGTNWYKEIFRNAVTQSHNLTVSGGAERSSYLFSVNYLNQQGTLISTDLKRYAVRANTQFNVKDKIRIGENAYIQYRDNPVIQNQNEGNPISMSYREQPIIPVRDIMGNYAGTKSEDLGNATNPVAIVERRQIYNNGRNWDINGNVFAEVDFLRHFTVRTNFGGSVNNYYYYNYSPLIYENAEGRGTGNTFNEGAGYNSSSTWNNTLTYNNTFGKHTLKALVGTEAIRNYGRSVSGTRGDYFSADPNYLSLNTGSPSGQTNSGGPYQSALFSIFGRVDYNFEDRFLVQGTIRRDGASVFAPEKRYAVFPSGSAAWRISKEDFMKSLGFVNDLKIRYSWGKLGSIGNVQGTNAYSLYGSNIGRSFYDLQGNNNTPMSGFFASTIGNPGTTFEADIISNVGVDATLFRNKFDFTIEWYKKKVSGLLYQAPVAAIYGGANPPLVNIGNIQNTGIDASATYHGGFANGLKFDVTATFTSYKNRIVTIPGNYLDVSTSDASNRLPYMSRAEVGHPVGAFFGYKILHIFQDTAEVSKAPTQDGAAPGRFRYEDNNSRDDKGNLTGKPDGKITEADRTYVGDPNPKFTYGLNISLSYKNFDFSTFLYGSQGNDIVNYVKYWTDFPQVFKGAMSREAATNSWTPQNPNAKVPMLETNANFSNTSVFNSYYVENGSFLRAKQMTVGYTLPQSALTRFGIDRLRIYVQAANLFTITKYSGLDPELQTFRNSSNGQTNNPSFGIDFGNYPHTRSYLVGVSLGF